MLEAAGIKDLDEEVHEELYRDEPMLGTSVLVASSFLPFPMMEFEVDGSSTQTSQRIGSSAVTEPVFGSFAYSTYSWMPVIFVDVENVENRGDTHWLTNCIRR